MNYDNTLDEKERVKEECLRQIENILSDKREGKVKNKSYPIRRISTILYHLYGIRDDEIKKEMEKRGF